MKTCIKCKNFDRCWIHKKVIVFIAEMEDAGVDVAIQIASCSLREELDRVAQGAQKYLEERRQARERAKLLARKLSL